MACSQLSSCHLAAAANSEQGRPDGVIRSALEVEELCNPERSGFTGAELAGRVAVLTGVLSTADGEVTGGDHLRPVTSLMRGEGGLCHTPLEISLFAYPQGEYLVG